jgi:hypothetical protein
MSTRFSVNARRVPSVTIENRRKSSQLAVNLVAFTATRTPTEFPARGCSAESGEPFDHHAIEDFVEARQRQGFDPATRTLPPVAALSMLYT